MSTITKEFTKEQLIEQAKKNIEVLRGAVKRIPGASDAAVIHLKLAEITLASLEAEADAVCQHQWKSGGANKLQRQKQCVKCGRVELAAPPAPVSVPDEVSAEDCPEFVKYDVTDVDEAWASGCRKLKVVIGAMSKNRIALVKATINGTAHGMVIGGGLKAIMAAA